MTRGAKLARVVSCRSRIGFLRPAAARAARRGARAGAREGRGCLARELLSDPDTISSIKLTLLTAAIVVPANTIFGICAAWAIARFEFRGKSLLVTLIDLPFAVSPVIAGLVLVFLFGVQRLVRRMAARAEHLDHLRRPGHRAGDDLHLLSLCRTRADPAHAAAGQRRRGRGALARRRAVAHVPAHHAAEDPLGTAVRRDPLQRARDGRVRRGLGRLGPHPRRDEHDAAAGRDPLQRVQLRRRLRGRLAPRDARDPHTRLPKLWWNGARGSEGTELAPAVAEVESRLAAARQAVEGGPAPPRRAAALARAADALHDRRRWCFSPSSRSRSPRSACCATRRSEQALSSVRAAAHAARYEIRRVGEDDGHRRAAARQPRDARAARRAGKQPPAATRAAPFLRDRGARRLRAVSRHGARHGDRRADPLGAGLRRGRRTGRGIHDREPASAGRSARSSRFRGCPAGGS